MVSSKQSHMTFFHIFSHIILQEVEIDIGNFKNKQLVETCEFYTMPILICKYMFFFFPVTHCLQIVVICIGSHHTGMI